MSTAVLLSGGIDSTAVAVWRRPEVAITIDYGQRPAAGELRAARRIASELGIKHELVSVDCSSLGSGDLAGAPHLDVAPVPEWWPYRNQLLVTLGAMRAISIGVDGLLFGTVRSDRAHADGTPEFIAELGHLLLSQEGSLTLEAPAVERSSAELVRDAGLAMDLLAWTHSCHVANFACGNCRGCNKHANVLRELGFIAE